MRPITNTPMKRPKAFDNPYLCLRNNPKTLNEYNNKKNNNN